VSAAISKEFTMIVCGIELAASEARLVILDGTKEDYVHVETGTRRIGLPNDEIQDEVKAFRETVYAFLRENRVGRVTIKKRGKRGDYAGGPVSFKLEGVFQLYPDCDVILLPPQTISATKRSHIASSPEDIRKYQQVAFETAFTGLD
jgi:hypothetical protein